MRQRTALTALQYPLKKIILVHGRERLLARSTAKASRYAEAFLRRHGCELAFNERVLLGSMVSRVGSRLEPPSVCFQAESGTVFTAQMAFVCTGMVSLSPPHDVISWPFQPFSFQRNAFLACCSCYATLEYLVRSDVCAVSQQLLPARRHHDGR